MDVGIGARTKTGWAVLVTVGLEHGRPSVLDRRRLDLVDDQAQAFAYHHAATLPLDDAASFLRDVDALTVERAKEGVTATVAALRFGGHDPVVLTVPVGGGSLPDDLATVLGNHTLLHTGEGLLYAEAVAEAGEAVGLTVVEVPAKELAGRLAVESGLGAASVDEAIGAAGKALGPPWRKEQKEAAQAAWLSCLSA
jgi:hypothetical protein